MIKKIDLGGTACYESDEAVSISLDGTTSDDLVVIQIIGDYRSMPFSSGSFSEAFGSCILEEPDEEYHEIFREIHRVLQSGGLMIVKGCGAWHPNHLKHALDEGFTMIEECAIDLDTGDYDYPYVFRA